MPEGYDIEGLLQNGYWTNSRNQTPDPRLASYPDPVDPAAAPRWVHSNDPSDWAQPLHRPPPTVEDEVESLAREHGSAFPAPADAYTRSFRPPPPTVEDEAESLAREHGSTVSAPADEEPKHRGDVDQQHVIEVVHEHNPERRFVVVPSASVAADEAKDEVKRDAKTKSDDEQANSGSQPGGKETYEANTYRKYVPLTPEQEDTSRRRERDGRDTRPSRDRRRSRLEDLPAIVTDIGPDRDEPRRGDMRRSKSATGSGPSEDYFSPRRREQKSRDESRLAPDVIKHSTRGRDRAYYDYGGSTSPNQGRVRPSKPDDQYDRRSQRKNEDSYYPSYSASPVDPRKSSFFERPQDDRPRDDRPRDDRSRDDRPRNGRKASDEDVLGYDRDYVKADKGRQYQDAPSKPGRKDSSSSRQRPERESLRPRSSSYRGKDEAPPPYRESRQSSDEDAERRGPPRRRGKSFVNEDRNGYLTTPNDGKPSGYRSKPASPLVTPHTSQGEFSGDYYEGGPSRSPRSATFPTPRDFQKADSKYPVGAEQLERPSSRSSTTKSVFGSAAPIVVPIIAGAAAAVAAAAGPATTPTPVSEPNSSVGRQPIPAVPPPSKGRVMNDSRADARSSSSTLSSSPPKQSWQPPRFDPVRDGVQKEQTSTSYRRYSEGAATHNELPDLPDCPRTEEEAGHMDWLTLPKCNNFNICPSCYQAAFGNTEFRNAFVPAPFRAQDRPIKCDFGTSTWYHIAWLLTHKYQKPDLRLFQGLVSVTKAHQPCSGLLPAYRIWYTIKDPVTQRPVRSFKICHNCAKNIEVLLPNLSGAFVPMDSPAEPTKGTCDMHQHGFSGDRKRFVAYFDLMETASDMALSANSAPDIRYLADRIRELSLVEECYGGQTVANRKWFTMRSVPDCTVCEECFNELIWPEIERDRGGIATEFYKNPQKLPVAACQLYSMRMRSAFQKAVARNDVDYFQSALRRRQRKEREFHDKIRGLDPNVLGAEWVAAEVERLKKEWRRYE